MLGLTRITLQLVAGVFWLAVLLCRPTRSVQAESLFLRRQLAPFKKRGAQPRRVDAAARISLAVLARFFDWRNALFVVQPKTMIRWHVHAARIGVANTAIFLKPEGSKGNTSDFKGKAGTEIQKLGTVVGVFDNEPANLVEIRKLWGFKSAKLFFVNTQWAGYKMEEMVHTGNYFWLRNFETL